MDYRSSYRRMFNVAVAKLNQQIQGNPDRLPIGGYHMKSLLSCGFWRCVPTSHSEYLALFCPVWQAPWNNANRTLRRENVCILRHFVLMSTTVISVPQWIQDRRGEILLKRRAVRSAWQARCRQSQKFEEQLRKTQSQTRRAFCVMLSKKEDNHIKMMVTRGSEVITA